MRRTCAGQSLLISLDGNGVQLGNQEGTLALQDDHNVQVDVVTYMAADTSPTIATSAFAADGGRPGHFVPDVELREHIRYRAAPAGAAPGLAWCLRAWRSG